MISDFTTWHDAENKAHEINERIKALRDLCAVNGLVLTAIVHGKSVFFRVYGKGTMEYWDDNPVEVWQNSTGCSEQGSTRFPTSSVDVILNAIPGEDDWVSSALSC